MLAQILKAEPQNEQAWLWLAQVAANDDQRRYCLEQVLKIKPDHDLARRGLTILQQRQDRAAPPRQPIEPGAAPSLSRPIETGSISPLPIAPPPPEASDLVTHARTLMAQGHRDQARQLLQQVVEANPGHEEAWEKLIDLAPDVEAQRQLFKEWLHHNPNSRRALRKFKSLDQKERPRLLPCLLIAGALGLVLVLVLGGALAWFFWLDDVFKPTYLHEDIRALLRLKQISPAEIREVIYQARDKKAQELQAAVPYMADPVKAEETWGLYEYWINADAPQLMGYIEMRPLIPEETGGDLQLDMGKAEFLIEFKSDSILTPMNEQEKTKYLHIEASRTKDEDNKWQVVSLEEIPPETVTDARLSCTACPSTSQPTGLTGCLPYWQATLMLLENNDMAQGIPIMQACRWVTVD